MFKKNLDLMNVKVLFSSVIPFAGLLATKVIPSGVRAVAKNSPASNPQLMIPTSPQGTGFFISPSDRFRR
jgi:hypothetical protein